jgi:hypothetical protein
MHWRQYIDRNVIIYIILVEAVGLTFTTDAVMLHHGYRTTLMTPMGIVIKTFERKHYCVGAVGSSKYLLTKG